MRIYLQSPGADGKVPRYVNLFLQPDLLGGWNLVKESGTQGTRGRLKTEHFPDRERAADALLRERDEQIRRGYVVVFIQGERQA